MDKIFHICLSVRGFLSNQRYPEDYRGMFKHDDNTPMYPFEARNTLYDELAKGHEVIPFGPVCDGFDYSGGGCPGHEVAETDFHDDKASERMDLHTPTQPGDLDLAGRPLRQGS